MSHLRRHNKRSEHLIMDIGQKGCAMHGSDVYLRSACVVEVKMAIVIGEMDSTEWHLNSHANVMSLTCYRKYKPKINGYEYV